MIHLKKKLTALMLMLALVAALFAGCSGTGNDPDATTAGTTAATTEQTTVATTQPVDLEGYTFTLATIFADKFIPKSGQNELHDRWAAEYERIQEENNFTLSIVVISDTMETIITSSMAGETLGDFVMVRHSKFFPLSVQNYFKPLDGQELINAGFDVTDETKWDQFYTPLSKFNDQTWAVMTNSEYYLACFGFVYCFNPAITQQFGYSKDDIYNLVRNGEWTYDKLVELAELATIDKDGDGIYDQWGVGKWGFGTELLTNGYNPIQNVNGKIKVNLLDPKLLTSLEFLQDYQSIHTKPETTDNGEMARMFAAGDIAFTTFYGWNFWEEPLSICDFDFGVIPVAKGPDADNYVSVVNEIDSWVMQATNKNVEKSVICMNLWGDIMTDDTWVDRTKEIFRDDESWEMFENYIYPNTILNSMQLTEDIWFNYFRSQLINDIRMGNAAPSSVSEAIQNTIQGVIDSTFNQ